MSATRAASPGGGRYLLTALAIAVLSCGADPGHAGRSSHEWIAALDDTSTALRIEAADALGKILKIQPKSPKVVRALIAALADSVDDVRMAAATALVAEGVRAEGAVPGIHAALHDSAHATVRSHAALILGILGTSAGEGVVSALTEALGDPEPEVRSAAAEALGKLGDDAAASVPAIRSRLTDASSNVRLKALEAVYIIGAPDTVMLPVLRNALSDSDASVRAAAAYMLGGLRADAAPALDAILVALGDGEADVRVAAVFAIAEIGPAAHSLLPHLRRMLNDPNQRVRRFAIDAIARVEKPDQQGHGRGRRTR